jgi:hypothetical protein
MSKRNDIIDGSLAEHSKYGLVYTRKCGWIDLGHANPRGGAERLWNNLRSEIGPPSAQPGYYVITYGQSMGFKHKWVGSVKMGVEYRYKVRKGISLDQKKSVGLAIFLNVSTEFETMQGNWLFQHVTDSSFSCEDLVSNLVGFYRAVDPGTPFVRMCEPVSKEIALMVWDKYGAVGSNKNRLPAPYLYPIPGSGLLGPISTRLPSFFNTIRPASSATLFQKLD